MADQCLINSVENCVDESLDGFSKLHPNLFVDLTRKIVFNTGSEEDGKIALVCGGGSGHEPFPAGYVGEGMLTASVSGAIFTSPPPSHILHGIRLASIKSSEILLLVPNYTGDVLNFGLAAETARGEGVQVESVTVGEDVAQEVKGGSGRAGKRGMCGLVLVIKIAGHLAKIGRDLATVKRLSEEAVRSMASMGVCVRACSKPGVGLLFELEGDELEVGVGVHGEAGIARVKRLSAHDIVEMILKHLIQSLQIGEGDEIVALVNNLGALSYLEQWLIAGEVETQLNESNIKTIRLYAGCFFTSLNMSGVQVCLLKLKQNTKETFLTALDSLTTASSWPNRITPLATGKSLIVHPPKIQKPPSKSFCLSPEDGEFFRFSLKKISEELAKEESTLNRLDSACGDGDCGTTFARLASLIKAKSNEWDFTRPADLFLDFSSAIEESIGGTTGAIYGLFLRGCNKELEKFDKCDAQVFSKCWRAGVEVIKKYSSARVGDRTMLDSLETGCEVFETQLTLEKPEEAYRRAVKAAVEGCQNTKFLEAFAGRASYTSQSRQTDVDAGAYAVTIWLRAIQQTIEETQRA